MESKTIEDATLEQIFFIYLMNFSHAALTRKGGSIGDDGGGSEEGGGGGQHLQTIQHRLQF